MPASEGLLTSLKNQHGINTYFETGLAEGNGVRKALNCGFDNIYSVDICTRWVEEGKENFKDNTNVNLIQGDSQNLAEYIKDIDEKILIFLDAHNDHSNMDYEQSDVDCPILQELEAIKSHPIKDHVIIIDDVRVIRNDHDDTLRAIGGEFRGRDCVNWGKNMNLPEIEKKILEVNPDYQVQYSGDQIVITLEPKKTKYSDKLESFNEFGFFIIEDFFSNEEVSRYRALCDNYFANHPSVAIDGGKVVPGWAGNTPEMEELNNLHEDAAILEVAKSALGESFVFAEHADLHQNKGTGWHRDVKDFERGGGHWPNWTNDFRVIKIAFLLQDHTDNDYGMWMEVGSHKEGVNGERIPIRSAATDLIVFDQRIHHKGWQNGSAYKNQFGKDRYLITYGYGVDNELTKTHSAGCKKRQDSQREKMR
jgi:hypothetical protein